MHFLFIFLRKTLEDVRRIFVMRTRILSCIFPTSSNKLLVDFYVFMVAMYEPVYLADTQTYLSLHLYPFSQSLSVVQGDSEDSSTPSLVSSTPS